MYNELLYLGRVRHCPQMRLFLNKVYHDQHHADNSKSSVAEYLTVESADYHSTLADSCQTRPAAISLSTICQQQHSCVQWSRRLDA